MGNGCIFLMHLYPDLTYRSCTSLHEDTVYPCLTFFLHFCKGFGANRTLETIRFMKKLISKVALNQAFFQLPFKGSYFKAFCLYKT